MLPERQQQPRLHGQHIESQLADFLCGHVCLLGIGNRQRRDDGVGSRIAGKLKSHSGIEAIDGGVVPENHLEAVAQQRPDTILMIDATDFGGEPGEMRLIDPDEVTNASLSTHTGSLRMLSKYLHIRTRARVGLLAIQPEQTGSGDDLSMSVFRAAKLLQESLPAICRQPD